MFACLALFARRLLVCVGLSNAGERQRGDDAHLRVRAEHGWEERQPLDVVPVQVADQAGGAKGAIGRPRLAEVADAGAEVEQDRPIAGDVDRHAGRVPAVAHDLGTVARRGSTDPVEGHRHTAGRGRSASWTPHGRQP